MIEWTFGRAFAGEATERRNLISFVCAPLRESMIFKIAESRKKITTPQGRARFLP